MLNTCTTLCMRAQANSVCCEDNADALTHHEVLLPGHLLCKFLREKLTEGLELFAALVRAHAASGNNCSSSESVGPATRWLDQPVRNQLGFNTLLGAAVC